ncbi:MAG: hypothetical protein ACREBO_08005 [Novosphingobium sp.]
MSVSPAGRIVATIDGQTAERDAVLAWEDKRAFVVMRQLGLHDVGPTRAERRAGLLARKLELGHAALRRMLWLDLFLSRLMAIVLTALWGKRRRVSSCELAVERGSAERFQRWFIDRVPLDDQAGMLAACPDHYIIDTPASGDQQVVETAGGSPLTAEFVIHYGQSDGIVTPPDPAYPLQIVGVARLSSGRAVGGVRHQFRQEGEGFRAIVAAEFPGGTFASIVKWHRWHLACEFSNWIEAAAEG